jgi:hypothetical protein
MVAADRLVQVKIAVRRKIGQPFGEESACEMTCTCGKVLPAYRGVRRCPECGLEWTENGWMIHETTPGKAGAR